MSTRDLKNLYGMIVMVFPQFCVRIYRGIRAVGAEYGE